MITLLFLDLTIGKMLMVGWKATKLEVIQVIRYILIRYPRLISETYVINYWIKVYLRSNVAFARKPF